MSETDNDERGSLTEERAATNSPSASSIRGENLDSANAEKTGPSPSGAPAGEGNEAKATAEDSAQDWRDVVSDPDLRRQLDRYSSVEDMARHNLALRRRLSRSVTPPSEDADQQELAEFRSRMGVPEAPEDYAYEAPDDLPEELADLAGDDEMAEIFDVAHRVGLTQNQLSGLLDWRFEKLAGLGQKMAIETGRARAVAEAALQREWGRDYERNLNLSQRALREFGGEGLITFLTRARVDGTQLASHPEIIRWAANAGRALVEGSLRPGGESSGLTAEERRAELTRGIHDARAAGDGDRAKELDAERRALTGHIYGG